MKTLTVLLVSILTSSLLAGCNSAPKRDPEYAATLPVAYADPLPRHANGTIYQPGTEVRLFEDLRARRIGDILTIKLQETTNATKKAKTDVDRSNTSTVTNPTILGTTPQFNLPSRLPLLSTQDNTMAASLSSSHAFESEGDSSQSNSLSGDITVTVADVLPNGNLFVRGEKRFNLNQGNEYIKISGFVRPIDISADNSVVSTKLADATIIYNGDGHVAEANKVGWLARFFISALFPF